MIEGSRLRDAARVAAKAAHPTDVMLISTGFLVMAREGGLQSSKIVPFDELEVSDLNPLVAAVRYVNDRLS